MIRTCPQKPQKPQWNAPQNTSRTRQTEVEDNTQVARGIVDDRSALQKAQDWLSGVANEDDGVKDLVMQELWKKEDFGGA
jgi:hypothetical protein